MFEQNAYEILSIDRSATDAEIRKAYRGKALQLHPDKNAGDDALRAFLAVGDAYRVLSNSMQRSKLDSQLALLAQQKLKNAALTEERQQMKRQLAQRESTTISPVDLQRRVADELKRLRAVNEQFRMEMLQEIHTPNQAVQVEVTEKNRSVKVKWSRHLAMSKAELLKELERSFGHEPSIEHVVMRPLKNQALVVFKDLVEANAVVSRKQVSPLTCSWLDPITADLIDKMLSQDANDKQTTLLKMNSLQQSHSRRGSRDDDRAAKRARHLESIGNGES